MTPSRDEILARLQEMADSTTVDPTPLDAYGRFKATFGDLREAAAALRSQADTAILRSPASLTPDELNKIATEAFGEAAERARAFAPKPEERQPVAWQWRYVGERDHEWKMPPGGRKLTDEELEMSRPIEERPLYAAPQAPASGGVEIINALRDAFPHFQDDAPVTVEAIRGIGREWQEMVMGWEPQKTEIEFADHDGNLHKIIFESGDSSVGVGDGWVLADDSALTSAPQAVSGGREWDKGEHEGCGKDSERAFRRWSENQIHFAARALALANPEHYEDKERKGSLQPNRRAKDHALMALSAAERHALPGRAEGEDALMRELVDRLVTLSPVGSFGTTIYWQEREKLMSQIRTALSNTQGRSGGAKAETGSVSFGERESYELFLILDTMARTRRDKGATVNYFRERLLPAYRDWHAANPHRAREPFAVPPQDGDPAR